MRSSYQQLTSLYGFSIWIAFSRSAARWPRGLLRMHFHLPNENWLWFYIAYFITDCYGHVLSCRHLDGWMLYSFPNYGPLHLFGWLMPKQFSSPFHHFHQAPGPVCFQILQWSFKSSQLLDSALGPLPSWKWLESLTFSGITPSIVILHLEA